MQNLLCYSFFKSISVASYELCIKYKNLSTAVGCNTALCNLAPTCLYTLISRQDMSESVFWTVDPQRAKLSLPFCIWTFHSLLKCSLPSFQPFTWMAPLPQESSLIRVPLWLCFCPCCCKCLKCLSFSQIHPDAPVNAFTSNMVPSESISWSCYEHSEKAVVVFAVAFTPVVIILWLSSASHIDWVPWEQNPSYSTLWPPQS